MEQDNYLLEFDDRFISKKELKNPSYSDVVSFIKEITPFIKEYSPKYKFYIVGSFLLYLHKKLDRLPGDLDLIVLSDTPDNLLEIRDILDYLLMTSLKYNFFIDLQYETNYTYQTTQNFIPNFKFDRNHFYLKNYFQMTYKENNKIVMGTVYPEMTKKLIPGLYRYKSGLSNNHWKHLEKCKKYKLKTEINILNLMEYDFLKKNISII